MSSSQSARKRRSRRQQARKHTTGLAPGSLIYTGEKRDAPVAVRVLDYALSGVTEHDFDGAGGLSKFLTAGSVSWIDVDGVHFAERVGEIGELFSLHPLWLEDILNPTCRPKAEALGDKVLVIARMLRIVDEGGVPRVDHEQVALVLGPSWVISFQERPGDVWDGVRRRIRQGNGRIRKMGPDYLLHALLDSVVDGYFLTLEQLESRVDVVEDAASQERAGDDLPHRVVEMKGELTSFRNVVWPMREVVSTLIGEDMVAIRADSQPFFRDLYDHVVQLMDIVETSRERLVGVLELHLALTSHRMNVVMRLLTVVSTIFIPLTFLAGIYGMNFKWMPELDWGPAYPIVWALMLCLGLLMVLWFRRRGWF